jgi:hypothetical protein
MARMIITGFPEPPAGCEWCAVCVTLSKGAFFADPDVRAAAEKGLEDTTRESFVISRQPRKAPPLLLETAVTHAASPQFGLAVVPVCWMHAPAVNGNEAAPEPPAQGPTLYRGGMN